MSVTVHHGDALDVLAELPDASVDAVVTDPPYGLEFMGKEWDSPWRRGDDINADAGMAATGYTDGGNRLPRPTFTGSTNPKCTTCGGTRRGRRDGTAVVKVCLCDDGGRFPNVRAAEMHAFQQWCEQWAAECLRVLKPGGHLLAFGGTRTWHRLACAVEDAGFEVRDSIAWLYGSGFPKSLNVSKAIATKGGRPEDIRRAAMGDDYAPSGRGRVNYDNGGGSQMNGSTTPIPLTPEAQQWQGWGTALKPAFEPIVVARKPLSGTVAANVLAHGTGALNIDACRVADAADLATSLAKNPGRSDAVTSDVYGAGRPQQSVNTAGRWPTNVALDGTTADQLDAEVGDLRSGALKPYKEQHADASSYRFDRDKTYTSEANEGGPSRFFPVFRYEPKAPTGQRPTAEGDAHPTVKPLDLLRWLVRLVTPPGGTVLDPFAGSGTTGHAAALEGFDAILIEREADYLPLIAARLNAARWGATVVRHTTPPPAPDGSQTLALFDLEAPA